MSRASAARQPRDMRAAAAADCGEPRAAGAGVEPIDKNRGADQR
jgi:hypothetical protein